MPQHRKQVTYSQRPNHAARSVHARGERQFRTYDTSYIRPKKSKGPVIFAAILAIVVIGGLAFGALTLFNSCSAQPVELLAEGQEATVVVADGEGAQAVGKDLEEARLVTSASDFTKRVNELGVDSQLKPGTYTFAGGVTLDQIINDLKAGPKTNAPTIPEGYTLAQIAQSVSDFTEGRISVDDFTAASSDASVYAADYAFLADAGTNKLEGFLFPKTYEISDEATADTVVRMMLDQFQTETASLNWSYPQSQGLTVYDAVNLASIVEKESSGDEQIRAQVASVFYNRLSTLGDPSYGFLQSDATTAYEVGHDPSAEEVHAETPYSTYANTGLPPTPICSPSIDSLQAVCAPDQESLGKYFFFYFEGDQYYFSETYDEHQETFS
ncbi:endolytic transglycosylase MltG [Eggerthella sinensis]|uniref:Endolytic murein transglycosylase n=1 Tax=Eggerthella sinensis TaxID=242230 RepID=A0A3N0J2H0_9ACTN|nr:endolytic transglycosylase MltG [Eggerthella sinensis]RDB71379.1 endolytic transglycosylase MltG [Eggerthella sinensis]RNM43414.1 endolytic transglycosylase MltG [Eggerthella sinensis]